MHQSGVVIGSAVFPVAFAISWSKCSAIGAITGAVVGAVLALSSWLIYGAVDGGISVDNLGRDEIMLTGNLVAILSSGAICFAISMYKPDNCDWSSTKSIPLIEDDPNANIEQETEEALSKAMRSIIIWGCGLTIVLIIAWPLLTLPVGVFSKGYFTFWVRLRIPLVHKATTSRSRSVDILTFESLFAGGYCIYLGNHGNGCHGHLPSIRGSKYNLCASYWKED